MNIDTQDRLVHILLLEELGGETSPDLTQRVLQRTAAGAPRRARPWVWALAAAAAVAIAAGAWLLLGGQNYPAPAASGEFQVVGGGAVTRGATLATEAGTAKVVLGDYCHVNIEPQTRLRLQGRQRAEEVYLEKGAATCEVDHAVGTFDVHTECGTVSVTGTKFTVRMVETKGEANMLSKRMVVKVLVGAVLLSGAWGSTAVAAGEEKTVGDANGVVTGVVTAKANNGITVKEGDKEGVRYTPKIRDGGFDKDMVKKIEGIAVGSKVKIVWTFNEHRRIESIEVLEATSKPAETPKASEKPKGSETPAAAGDSFTGTVERTNTQHRPRLSVGGTKYELKAGEKADASVAETLTKISNAEATGTYVVKGKAEGNTITVTSITKQ